MLKITLYFSFLFSIHLLANCEPVSLYEAQYPLNDMSIVNQGEIASCYAQTTAQMVEYHLRSESYDSPEVKGLWVALVHKLKRKVHWSPGKLDYSLLEWAIKDLEEKKNCSIEDYNQGLNNIRSNNNISDDDLVYFLHRVFVRYKKNLLSIKYRKNALQNAYNKVVSDKFFKNKISSSIFQQIAPMQNYKLKGFLKYLEGSVFKSCQDRIDLTAMIPEVISTARGFESDDMIINVMSNILTSAKPQPIGLGYCSNIFDNPPGSLNLIKRPRLLNMVMKAKKCSAHYSVVVGQRPKGNSCQFMIRNSYGTGKWAVDRSCLCDFKDGSRGDCHSESLPVGSKVLGCWVDGKELAQNTFDLSYFVK